MIAVIAVMPCTPQRANAFRSAWMPAPPPESEPAIESTRGVCASVLSRSRNSNGTNCALQGTRRGHGVCVHRSTSASDRRSHPQRSARRESQREDPRRALGRLGERLAAAHLQRLGFAILARNVRTRHGEIDLIAFDGEALVFVEVKTRRSAGAGS